MGEVLTLIAEYLNLPFANKEEDYLSRALHFALGSNNEVTVPCLLSINVSLEFA